jgi:hypothetical protein
MYLKLYYIIQHFSTFVLQKNVFLRIRKYLNWNKNIGLEHKKYGWIRTNVLNVSESVWRYQILIILLIF